LAEVLQRDTRGGAAAEVWDRSHRGLTVGLLATIAFTAFEALAIATALPTTVAEIGGIGLYGWAFSAFMLSSLIGITTAGGVADRRGPALPFLLGAVLFVAGLVIAGTANTMLAIVVGRLVQGLGSGAIGSIAYVAVGRGYSPEARSRMIALLSTAWVVPGLIGPMIAGLVTDTFGWRWVFLGLAPATALGAAIAAPSLHRLGPSDESSAVGDEASRARDAVLLALGTALVLVGLEIEAATRAIPFALAGVVVAVPAARRLLPAGSLSAQPGLPAAVALIGLAGFTFFGAEIFVPLALTGVRDQSATVAGLPLTVGALAWTAGAWLQAREAEHRSRRLLVATGFALIGLGVAGTATILSPAVPLLTAGPTWALAAFGMGLTYSTLTLVILECARPGEEGKTSASLQLAVTLGIALGTGSGGAALALATRVGSEMAMGIAAFASLVVALAALALALTRRIPARRIATETDRSPNRNA